MKYVILMKWKWIKKMKYYYYNIINDSNNENNINDNV